jgi:6-phosphogluconolactonase (cycloisomerase 2 family)
MLPTIVHAATQFWSLAQGRKAMQAALLLCFAGLIAGCGFSSTSISIVGPTPPTLTSISVVPANSTLHVGLTRQFIATGSFSDGSQQNMTASVTWSSSATNVASINNTAGSNGIATAVSAGSTTITASSGALSGSTTLNVTSTTLVSIGVTPATPTIAKGTTQQFMATGVYSDNTTQNLTNTVTWHAVNPAVASITTAIGSGGLATGVAPGTTQITATLGGVVGSTNLKVTAATLVSIAVTPANSSIPKGTVQQLAATGTYSDNSTQDLTASVAWTPTASSVANVSNAAGSVGKVTALSPGTVTITASLGAVTGSTMLTVTPAALVSIAVMPANASIANGTTQPFTATGTYTDSSTLDLTTQVTWAPATSAVATVSNTAGSHGLASALSPGTVTVTATLGTIVGPAQLTVTAATLVSIAVTPATATIRIGATQQYLATGHFSDLTTQDITTLVTWNSATAATATISNAPGTNGLATGLAPGTTFITAASGAITSNQATLTVVAFAYAVNFGSNNVSQFVIGPDGTLAAIGTGIVAAGTNPFSLAVDSAGKYVYVANFTQPGTVPATISQYIIGADGSLTAIGTGSVAATQHGPNGIVVNPTAPYVYTANFGSDNVSQYRIDAGGALTFVATAASGSGPASIALNPAGTFAYVANYLGGNVSQYSVSTADGSLTILGTATVPAGNHPNGVVVDPSGQFVYVPNNGDNTVSQYRIGAGGALTAIAAAVPSGSGPWSITIDSAGHHAYVPNRNDGTVWHYTIDTTSGALTWVNTLTLPAGTGPTSLAIDPSGLFAYISDRGPVGSPQTTISQCSVATDGSLTLLTPSTAPAGTAPAAIITVR